MDSPRLSPSYLARQEIRRRPWQFALSALAVATGVATVVGSLVVLGSERQASAELLRTKERELAGRFSVYRQDLAAAMTKAGFNVVILPRDQDLSDWYSENFAAKQLPADGVEQLGSRPLETIEHLVPRLTGRLEWPERKWTVIVCGMAARPLQPSALATRFLARPVPPGAVDVGSEIARAFALSPGQDLAVAGKTFRIRECRSSTGTKQDITLHLPIEAAREILGRPGQVNEIVALEQPGAWADIERIRAELGKRLPTAQVLEISNRVVATVRARRMAERESRQLLDQEKADREKLHHAHSRLALAISLAAVGISALWLAVMTVLNLSRRRGELGLLSALGLSPRRIRAVFMARIAFVAAFGIALGALPWLVRGLGTATRQMPFWLLAAAIAALPPILATAVVTHHQIARRDPADVLKNEV